MYSWACEVVLLGARIINAYTLLAGPNLAGIERLCLATMDEYFTDNPMGQEVFR